MVATEAQTSPFKMMVFFAFFGFAAVGVVMFAMFQAGAGDADLAEVTLWGTIPEEQFNTFLNELSFIDDRANKVKYSYHSEDGFDIELIEALASGYGPDILLMTTDQIMHHRDRIFTTPYEQFDTRMYKDTYVEATESLLLPEGVIAMPVAIDPLVLYWNRTLLSNNQYVQPPKQWNDLFKMSQKITRRSEGGNIELATIALGEFTNIRHAKDIFIAMLMQAGGSVTTMMVDGDQVTQIATLSDRSPSGTLPAQDALRFYTEFANPTKSTYTWSKAQPDAREAFVSGDLAMYVGYASELQLILDQNPNLNFDVAELPQLSGGAGQRRSTIARVYALAIPHLAYSPQDASTLRGVLTTKAASAELEKVMGLPSPRKDLLILDLSEAEKTTYSSAIDPANAVRTTFHNSAMMAQSWRDPNPSATYNIIAKMVESVVSGRQRMSQAVDRAQRELSVLLGNNF